MAETDKKSEETENTVVPKSKTQKFGVITEKTHFRCDPIALEHDDGKIIYVNLGIVAEHSPYIKSICESRVDLEKAIEMPGDENTWIIIMELSIVEISIMDNHYENGILPGVRRDILFFTMNKICFNQLVTKKLLQACIGKGKVNEKETMWNLLPDEYLDLFIDEAYSWLTKASPNSSRNIEWIEKNEFALFVVENTNKQMDLYKELKKVFDAFSNKKFGYKITCNAKE